MLPKYNSINLWAGILSAVAIKFIFFADNPPFWDSILLCSDVPRAYFNNWPSLFLPESYARYPRYPPGLGYYIASVWKLTGVSIVSLNLSFLPFIVGIVYQLYLLCKKFRISALFLPLWLLISVEPTLSCQIYLINTDTLILFFFLLGMNAILQGKKYLLPIALSALVLVSPRGMVYAAALFVSHVFLFLQNGGKKSSLTTILRFLLPYISALIVQCTWLVLFQYHYGWSVYGNAGAYSFGIQGGYTEKLKTITRNLAIIGWRLVDFGRIFTFILAGFLLRKVYHSFTPLQRQSLLQSGIFAAGFFLVATAAFCMISLPVGHRYFLPGIFLLYLMIAITIQQLQLRARIAAFVVLFMIQVAGNNLVYPRGIAIGWDATLAHLPYHSLRTDFIHEMEKKNILPSATGTWFPNTGRFDNVDFNGSNKRFKAADLTSDQYILYSNVFNDVSDQELEALFQSGKWEQIHYRKKGRIEMILFKKSH